MDILKIYNNLIKYPLGKTIFTKTICFKAPYFSTISPELIHFSEGHCEFKVKNKKSIRNHLNTVHAIAMCNLAELCAGMCMETIIDDSAKRWIPKGMTVRYLKKASTDLVGIAKYDKLSLKLGSNIIKVDVLDTSSQIVFDANIDMHVSVK